MQNFKRPKLNVLASLIFVASFSLTACGGSSSNDDNSPTVNFSANATSDLLIGTPYDIATSNVSELTAKYGTVTKLSGNADTWQYTFDITNLENHSLSFPITETFTITATDGAKSTKEITIDSKDELFKYQWHIYNDGKGKEYFGVTENSIAGIDLNIIPAWNQRDSEGNPITGKNIVVAVWDASIDFQHPDLAPQKFTPTSTAEVANIINQELLLQDILENESETHGSAVSGIIGAASNNFGVRGEAFDAKLYSYKNTFTTSLDSILTDLITNKAANLMNVSLGENLYATNSPENETLLDTLYLANIPIIQSMGNEELNSQLCITSQGTLCDYPAGENAPCIEYGAPCQFKQIENLDRHPATILVGAVNAQGIKSSYSSSGASLWISGMGGEYGYSDYNDTSSAAIVTTLSHYSCADVNNNTLDSPNGPWRTNIDKTCNYTSAMNGTSSSAPSISGIVALLKQLDKNITVPQVKYILAKTARNDSVIPSFAYDPIMVPTIDDTYIYIDKAWQTNAAGMRFSNWYGFGLPDANAAVTLAKNCATDEGCDLRKNLPIKIVNGNEANCTRDTVDGIDYTCTFTDLEVMDADGNLSPLTSDIEIESVSVDLGGFSFDSSMPQSYDFCTFNTMEGNEENDKDVIFARYKVFTNTQINIISPNETDSILKSYLSHWLYQGSTDPKDALTTKTNTFYREVVAPTDTWKLHIKSACTLNLETLNSHMALSLEGYKK